MNRVIMILAGALSTFSLQAGMSKLGAIGMLESGNDDRAVGRAGEVSRYQIKPGIWKRYTSLRNYHDIELSSLVARQYLSDLEADFKKRTGREPTDFDRYVLWNAGPSYYARIGFSSTRVHPVVRERAQRYVNLREMKHEEPSPRQQPLLAVGGLGQ